MLLDDPFRHSPFDHFLSRPGEPPAHHGVELLVGGGEEPAQLPPGPVGHHEHVLVVVGRAPGLAHAPGVGVGVRAEAEEPAGRVEGEVAAVDVGLQAKEGFKPGDLKRN